MAAAFGRLLSWIGKFVIVTWLSNAICDLTYSSFDFFHDYGLLLGAGIVDTKGSANVLTVADRCPSLTAAQNTKNV